MKVRLNHYCNLEGAVGGPAEVIECSKALGEHLIQIGGGEEVAKSTKVTLPAESLNQAAAAEKKEALEAEAKKRQAR